MDRQTSSYNWNAITCAIGAGVLFNGAMTRHAPGVDHALWGNVHVWSSSPPNPYNIGFSLLLIVACGFNGATGRPRRLWRAILVLLVGLTGFLLVAAFAASMTPRIGLFDSLGFSVVGLASALLFVDGTPALVWRHLFTKGTDYAARFFPLAGFLIGLAFEGLWVSWFYRQAAAQDDTPVIGVICFALGVVSLVIGGKQQDVMPPLAASVEA